MELGCAGVLMNTAIAEAKDPVLMARAMKAGTEAGRMAYLAGRMDICYENMVAVRENISERPSDLLREIYYDSVTHRLDALQMCVDVGGDDKVMYGSDWPHNIGDMRGCLARVDALPYDQRVKVRGRNAMRIFNV